VFQQNTSGFCVAMLTCSKQLLACFDHLEWYTSVLFSGCLCCIIIAQKQMMIENALTAAGLSTEENHCVQQLMHVDTSDNIVTLMWLADAHASIADILLKNVDNLWANADAQSLFDAQDELPATPTADAIVHIAFANCNPTVVLRGACPRLQTHLGWLSNTTHLQLDVTGCSQGAEFDALLAVAGALPRLTHLTICSWRWEATRSHPRWCSATPPSQAAFGALVSLSVQCIDIDCVPLVVRGTSILCANLTTLHITPMVGDTRELALMPNLHELRIENHIRCAYGPIQLMNSVWLAAPALETLWCKYELGFGIHSGFEGLHTAECRHTLQHVTISVATITTATTVGAFEELNECAALVDVEFHCVLTTAHAMAVMARVHKLRTLSLGWVEHIDGESPFTQPLHTLTIMSRVSIANVYQCLRAPCAAQLVELCGVHCSDILASMGTHAFVNLQRVGLVCDVEDAVLCAHSSLPKLLIVCPHISVLRIGNCSHAEHIVPQVIDLAILYSAHVEYVFVNTPAVGRAVRQWPTVKLITPYDEAPSFDTKLLHTHIQSHRFITALPSKISSQ
jgi:hypothetical protein